MKSKNAKHRGLRGAIYFVAIVASVVCATLVIQQLIPTASPDGKSLLWPWTEMKLNERGDFIAGFFAPLALIWALVAVILQQISLNIQQQEMERQREEAEEQTKIFSEELKNLERNDLRSHLKSLERQLQRHAVMIREQIDAEFDRDSHFDYSERDVDVTIALLKKINKDNSASVTGGVTKTRKLIDRMCTYVARFERLKERAVACGLREDFNYFRHYTPYGHLLTSCNSKLKMLARSGVCEGRYWVFNDVGKIWVNKSSGKINNDGIRVEEFVVKRGEA